MIKLFVTDLDGCISEPFKTPNWEAINKIRELNIQSRSSDIIPPLTICTGRPYPYAEAVAQWLDIKLPFVFESAGLFHWDGHRFETAINIENGEMEPVQQMKKWLTQDVLPNYPGVNLEFSKMMDAGIVGPDEKVIEKLHRLILEKVESDYPGMEVHATDISVNTLMPGNDKLQGFKLLSKALDISFDEMGYIGDSSGDVPALKKVKMAFAPLNAKDIAKEHGVVIQKETTEAVLEAYHKIIEYNKTAVKPQS
ncbi:HAD hydrolase family protein [Rhodohalobacter sp.]|uniref:HAD hydrolase family protein n=1 Tax=Rhodohalobacter sp. TaxID=1974210 RepID=UPI002ACE4D49|nr:HAD hydrolase family protein [Rhodohalobacter sp.]MDZ7756919.1 HAD hydrolase family protein [Rhodohalobacter sp.]